VELAFEDAASELYRSFKFTKCFLEDKECLDVFKNKLKGDWTSDFPKIVLSI